MPDLVPIKTALLSVSDKTDLVPFAQRLINCCGTTIISTGGTAKALTAAGIDYVGIDIHDSSLEDIFVDLVERRPEHNGEEAA